MTVLRRLVICGWIGIRRGERMGQKENVGFHSELSHRKSREASNEGDFVTFRVQVVPPQNL